MTEQGLFVDEDDCLLGLGSVPASYWSQVYIEAMLSPLGWVLFRTLQRLQCNCANKNALLTCENKKLTATKKNPGQFMLRGFYSLLPQLAGSLIRAVSGDGDARIRPTLF